MPTKTTRSFSSRTRSSKRSPSARRSTSRTSSRTMTRSEAGRLGAEARWGKASSRTAVAKRSTSLTSKKRTTTKRATAPSRRGAQARWGTATATRTTKRTARRQPARWEPEAWDFEAMNKPSRSRSNIRRQATGQRVNQTRGRAASSRQEPRRAARSAWEEDFEGGDEFLFGHPGQRNKREISKASPAWGYDFESALEENTRKPSRNKPETVRRGAGTRWGSYLEDEDFE